MAESFNGEINVGPPPVALRKHRPWGAIVVIGLVVILGAAAGLLWLDRQAAIDLTQTVSGDGASVPSGGSENAVSAADFAAFQAQTATSLQAANDLLGVQQAELKRLSEQLQGLTGQVAGLAARLDQSRPGASGMIPTAGPAAASAPATVPAPGRAGPTAPRKRPVADRPAGAISVGGAPLPAPSAR